ncbi:hypothetical protein GCM10011502_21870 [Oceanisphaera marina]|uniref:Uncharacterized protein n=1 Tax=Oceanisphaera marina TaxID=2017550 RepID=A0ABQ1IQY9_9GAMM|nr:hypothetical protein [Oceanisphaera marina]GGB48198.1 hypothetical protein GCM10011502_21870 [Oceanisphaera marina]
MWVEVDKRTDILRKKRHMTLIPWGLVLVVSQVFDKKENFNGGVYAFAEIGALCIDVICR